jgi:hypothetical protein
MLQNINLAFIILPFILAGAAYVKIVNVKTGNAMRDSLHRLKSVTIILGVLFVVLVFLLPTTATLSTFGYPETTADINSQEKVLKLLQRYNTSITRTIDVIFWMLFTLAFWFMTAIYTFVNIFKDKIDREIYTNKDENAI